MRVRALVAGGFLVALTAIAVSGCAVGSGGSASALATNRPADTATGCTTYAYRAIRAHERLTTVPAACRALTPSQRNEAVGLAIRMASGTGSKSVLAAAGRGGRRLRERPDNGSGADHASALGQQRTGRQADGAGRVAARFQ